MTGYLTASQLFDLVKARKKATQTGKRGGRYYVSPKGTKVYTGEKKVEPLLTLKDMPAPTRAIEEAISRRREAEEVQIGRAPKKVRQELRFLPKTKQPRHIETRKEQAAAKRAQHQGDWPAYICRTCKSPVMPLHNQPIYLKEVDPEEYDKRQKKWAKDMVAYKFLSSIYGEDEADKPPDPNPVVGRTTKAVMRDIKTGESKMFGASPELSDAVGHKVCPLCYTEYSQESKELGGKTEVKATRASIRVRSKRRKEEKREARHLRQAEKKAPGKRTPEQQAALDRKEAIESVQRRMAKEAKIAAKRSSQETRKKREEAAYRREEQQAREKAQNIFTKVAMDRGVPEDKARAEAEKLTKPEVMDILYRHEQFRMTKREERIKEIEIEKKRQFEEAMAAIAESRRKKLDKGLWVPIRRLA